MWKKLLILIASFMGILLVCFSEGESGQLRATTGIYNSSTKAISGALSSHFKARTGNDIYTSKTKIYYGLNDKKSGSPIETYEIIKNVKNYGTLIMPFTALAKAPFYIGDNAGYISKASDLVYNTSLVTFPEITGHFSALLTEVERSIAYIDKSYTQKLEGIVGTSKDDILFIPTVSEFQNGGTFGMNGKYRYADELDEIYLPEFKSYQRIGSYPLKTGSKTARRPRLEASDKKMKEYNGGDSAKFGASYWLFDVGLTYAPSGTSGYGGMDSYNNYLSGGTGDIEIIGFPEEKDQLAGAGNSFCAVRPAALIDLDKIVFGLSPLDSMAKTMTSVDPSGTNTLQIRVRDDNITLDVSESGNYGDYTKGKKFDIPYENATVGENHIISAIVTDKNDNIIFYQRLIEANTQTKSSGTITIDTSKFDVADDYHIYLVNENVTDNTRAITSSDLTEKISFNIVPALHDLTYKPARGTTVNNAYQTIEPGHVKVGDSVGSVTSIDGADPITYDIVSADSTQDAPTIFSVINGNVKVNSNANVTAPPGVYQFRVRVYDKFEDPKGDGGSAVDTSGNAVTGLSDQDGNKVTYGMVTDVITIVVYPHENQLTYTQQRFKGVFHTADKLNNTVTTEVLGKIRISPSARLAQLKEDGYELSAIEVVDSSGNVIPQLVIAEADSTSYSGDYEIKKGTGTFISSIDFQLRLTFKNTDTNKTSAVLIFDDKGKDYVFRVPGIMGDLEVDEPIYYGDEDKLATLVTEYMNGVPAYFTSTDESIISINDTDLNDDHSSPLEIHKIGTVGIEVCQTAEPSYEAGDPCPTSAVYGYAEVTVLPREITLKLSDKTIYTGMKFPSYTFESEPISGTFAYSDLISSFKVPENTSAKDNDTVLANTNEKGTYPITGSYSDTEKEKAFLSNYNVTIANGTLTIEEDTSNKSSYHLEDDEGNILAESTWYNHDVNVVIDVVNNDTGTYDQISSSEEFTNEDLTSFKVIEEGNIAQDVYFRINPESETERAGSIAPGKKASIYIDKKAPMIKGIGVTQTNTSPVSRILYSLTFGSISKPGVSVEVETEDPQAEGVNEVSGIKEITYQLYAMNDETKEIASIIKEETVEPNDQGSYTFTVNEEGSYQVCAITNDNAGNPSSEQCKEFSVKLNQDDNTDDENNNGQTPDDGNNDQDKPDDADHGNGDINNGENPDDGKGDNDQNQGGNDGNIPDDSNDGKDDSNNDNNESNNPKPDEGKGDDDQNGSDSDQDNENNGKDDEFIDTDGDDCPDLNIHYIDKNGNDIKLNWDINEDQIPDMNIDSNGDGEADLNIDTDEDGRPDLNLVILSKEQWLPKICVTSVKDQEGKEVRYCTGTSVKAQINIDLDGDRVPDINIDHKGDFKPHINISKDGKTPSVNIAIIHTWLPNQDYTVNDFLYDTMNIDEKKDINNNIDSDGDGKPDINIDLDGDGKPDINIDTDGDWIPDINIDGNGDGEPDINIDTGKDGIADDNIVDITDWKPNINGNKDGTEFGTMEIPVPDQKVNSSNGANISNDDTTVKGSYNSNGAYGSAIGGVKTGDSSNLKWLCIITITSLFVIIKATKLNKAKG